MLKVKNVTDKYHILFKSDDNHLNPLFDIKETPKRAYQLGIAAVFTGVGLSIYNAVIGMYVSSFLLGCFCFAILIFLVLKYNEAIDNLPIFIILMVCGLLIASVLLEGLQSEQYLLFFPTLIAIPIIIDLKKTKYQELFLYTAIIIVSFGICILVGHNFLPFETYNQDQIGKLSLVNRVIAISSTILFAFTYIFFEKKYIGEIMDKSQQVIDTRTRFLATMGHELRTPLNGIIGTINLLKQDLNLSQRNEYMQILKYCSDHMLQQVNNILDYNKIEADKLEINTVELNLRQLLINIGLPFKTIFQEKNLELVLDIDNELDVTVLADDLRLIQVFNNLLSNALKFTEKGYIKLKATCKNKSTQNIVVSFMVEDTGMGINEEDKKMIFEGFRQVYNTETKKQVGTGLGITIAVRLLKLMDSTLTLVSESGKGSKFNFDLKFSLTGSPAQVVAPYVSNDNTLSGITILLVEDNPINMLIAKKVLVGFNATVITANNGREAVDRLENNPEFDIILMDLEMPVMSGYDAIYEIKDLNPQIPVIAFTASLVDQQMLLDLIESGFAECILKPFQPDQLFNSIKQHLNTHLI